MIEHDGRRGPTLRMKRGSAGTVRWAPTPWGRERTLGRSVYRRLGGVRIPERLHRSRWRSGRLRVERHHALGVGVRCSGR